MERSARVLLVDDNDEFRETMQIVLETEGYEVRGAKSGALALQALDVALPDLILVDLWMPGMSGAELLRQLRRRGDVNPSTIVAMSGHVGAASSPARWFLKKPFDTDLMLAVVGELCQGAKNLRARKIERKKPSTSFWARILTASPART